MKGKTYTAEEIKKLAPGYRGKPENFKLNKIGQKRSQKVLPNEKPKDAKERPTTIAPPTHLGGIPTPQRNESLISDAIFGIDVRVVEIAPRQNFDCNYSKVVDIANEVYNAYRVDEKQLDRQIAKEELGYYATALMQMKLIDVKAKQGNTALTSPEKDIRKAICDETFNVPAPLSIYLNQIGSYTDKMGKETQLNVPALPTTVIEGLGGYHSQAINIDTHNLYEEVPSLGIAGDIVMALASADPEPHPNFRMEIPGNSAVTQRLAGRMGPIGPRRPEIIQRLAGYGITANEFTEFVPGTRMNLRYLMSLSDIIGKFETFKVEKVTFRNITMYGGETQVILSRPVEEDEAQPWNTRSVQTESAAGS